MPRFALLQNGSDVARHQRSDVNVAYDECAGALSAAVGVHFSFESFFDEAVGPMLDGLTIDDFACLVFASNALLSDALRRGTERRLPLLHRFVEEGGGIVMLHQWRDSLKPFLAENLLPALATRRSEQDRESARRVGRDDGLLHFPFEVDLAAMHDRRHDLAPERLFFKAISPRSLPPKLKPVLAKSEDELLLVRSDDHTGEHVVVSTVPLDWQRNTALLCNTILFACSGQPRRLVWRREEAVGAELMHRWLALDGSTVLRPCPATIDPTPSPDGWLLGAADSRLELLVVPPRELVAARSRPEVVRFLARGGALVTVQGDDQLPASCLSALIGSYPERVLASRLYGELRSEPRWRDVESAFNIRNVVCALHLLWTDANNHSSAAVSVAEVGSLRGEICTRLGTPRHQDDVGSSVALAQTAAFLACDSPPDPQLVRWLADRHDTQGTDMRIQVRAVFALWSGTPDPDLLCDAARLTATWGTDLSSPAPLVRVLDALAVLSQRGLLENDPVPATRLAATVCEVLDAHPAEPAVGWVSVEATADIVRGLVALLEVVPPSDSVQGRIVSHVATGIDALRRALGRYERNPDGVAWLARVTHALVVAERRFPIGLQRLATLQWPERQGPTATAELLPLIDHLGVTNKGLREENQALGQQVRAAALGRATATLMVSGLLMMAAVALVLLVVDVRSPWGIAAGLAALATALLGLLTGSFLLLERAHLLAGPARRLLALAEKVIPVAQQVAKLRGKG